MGLLVSVLPAKELVQLPDRVNTRAVADHYFIRRVAPLVPYPTSTPLPKADMAEADQARILNVYLRPWTLAIEDASLHVPHLKALDKPISDRSMKPTHRYTSKTAVGRRCHALAWRDYLKYHVVSDHAKRVILNFLAAAECTPDEPDETHPEGAPVPSQDVDTSWIDASTIHRLTAGDGFQFSKRSAQTVENIVQRWDPQQTTEPQTAQPRSVCAGMPDPGLAPNVNPNLNKLDPNNKPPPHVDISYASFDSDAAQAWLHQLQQTTDMPVPNQEQTECLQAIIARCTLEAQEQTLEAPHRTEPLRAIVHGVPGAGKSQTLHWIRAFFQTICKWTHLHEYAFVAPQNTQAALIDGVTLHSFADIKVKNPANKQSKPSGVHQFVKFQHLRWLIVDETSTAALEVLATLEKNLLDATRPKQSWKCRKNGTVRPFAGLNVLLAGDCWQFPAVKATSIFQNPFKSGQSLAVATLQKMLWTHNQTNMQRLFELTQEHRCVDPWLSAILKAARHGTLDQELWAFLHGFPTLHAGSWNPTSQKCDCGRAECDALANTWQQAVLDPQNHETWQDRQQAECGFCRTERHRRCIVAEASPFGPNPKATKFLEAPFVHGLNAAKYIAALLRARWVATEQHHLLLWAVAQDTPLFHTDPDTDQHELRARKENWLQRHDQSTGGVMGLLPLLPNMPVRITQTLPELKPFGLFKNTRGRMFNWTLHADDVAAIQQCTTQDLVLQHLPTCIFVEIPGATWQHRPNLPPGVACIRPLVQHWKLETHGTATVARKGFPIACDYAGTAHSFMGATLPACSLDLGFWDTTANRDAQLSAYMCLSRVKKSEDLCVARPFSPNLLSQGELIGPATFLEVHRQTLTLGQAKERFEKDQVQRKRRSETLLFCRGCSRKPRGNQVLLPLREFTSNNTWDPKAWYDIVQLGMDRLCSQCRDAKISHQEASEVGQAPSADLPGVACAFCQKTQLPQLGFCKKCLAEVRLACVRCDVGMKLKQKTLDAFNPAHIQLQKKNRQLSRAYCKTCEQLRPSNKSKQKVGQCRDCQTVVSVSHLHTYDSGKNSGICRKCWKKHVQGEEAAAKVCPQCSRPLHKAATPGSWCGDCAMPKCAGCKKVDRPHKAANHAKHRPFWRCAKCALDMCEKCNKQPVGSMAGPSPLAFCSQCRPNKQCPQCNGPLPAHAPSKTWCQACAYPPCSGGCGTPRPSTKKGEYHAKHLPEWTCQSCRARQEPEPKATKRHHGQSSSRDPRPKAKAKSQPEPDLPPLPPPATPPEDQPNPNPESQPRKRRKK